MPRFFDIMPPKPKAAPTPAPRRRKNNCSGFLFIVLIIIIAIFAFQFSDSKINFDRKTAPTPTKTPVKSNFELFNQSNQSNLTENKVISVRILNASGEDALAENAKKLLIDAGATIEQIGPSVNLYEQTIIYYKKDQLTQGQKIQNALKTTFQTKLQESENLGSTYDVLVIVGQK